MISRCVVTCVAAAMFASTGTRRSMAAVGADAWTMTA